MRGGRPKGGPALAIAYVLRRQDLTSTLMRLWLKVPPSFSFRAGQHCHLVLDGQERAFFIASAPWELPMLELVARLVPRGPFSRRLWMLDEGDAVPLRWHAQGSLTFDRRYRNQVLVSTGVGIAPFISVLRDRLQTPPAVHRFWLLHMAAGEELAYAHELEGLAARCPEALHYSIVPPSPRMRRPAASHAPLVTKGVSRWLDALDLDPRLTMVYLAGRRCLLEDLAGHLRSQGWRVKHEFID